MQKNLSINRICHKLPEMAHMWKVVQVDYIDTTIVKVVECGL
jgi:hypothetical protein